MCSAPLARIYLLKSRRPTPGNVRNTVHDPDKNYFAQYGLVLAPFALDTTEWIANYCGERAKGGCNIPIYPDLST